MTPRGEGGEVGGVEVGAKEKSGKNVKEIVGSVPRDWNWSTF